MVTVNRPRDVGLRDPGVGGWGHVFSRASVLSGVAAAGLAVSLLTQSVGEVVISGTWRRRARGSDRKKVDISISVELSYVPHSLMTIFYVSPPRGPDIQMSQSFGTVSVTVSCVTGVMAHCCLYVKHCTYRMHIFGYLGIFFFLQIIITQMLIIGL